MKDQDKTKGQLINELGELRRRISGLEALEAEHLRAKKSLIQGEEEKQTILDSLLEHVVYHDMEMRILWANRAACESVGMTREELDGRRCYEIWAKRSNPCKDCPVTRARKTGHSHALERKTADGRSWYIQGSPVVDNNGDIVGMVELTLEITERKRAEEALQKTLDMLERRVQERTDELLKRNEQLKREIENRKQVEDALRGSEQMLKVILAASPVGICLLRNRIIDWTNQAMYRIWGYDEGFLIGENTKILYPDVEEYERIGRKFYSEIEHNGAGHVETRWVTKDGIGIHCYLQGCPLDPSDISKGVIVAAMDITKLKQAEEQIQTLSQQLIHAQECERQMISCELHDSIAQNLSTLKIDCDMLFKLFEGQFAMSPELKERIAKLSKHIEQTIISVRQLAYDLQPPGLDEMGLVQALDMYCEDFSENRGVKADFHSAGMQLLDLGFRTEIHLYRLVQEGLNNIRKHADADQATIRLVGAFPNIILRIEDNGKGFDVKARELSLDNEKRMGLRSMKERVNLLGGQMTIQSRPMQGTKVFIKIPYKRQKDESEKKHTHH